MKVDLLEAIRRRCAECEAEKCAECRFGMYRAAIRTMVCNQSFKAHRGILGAPGLRAKGIRNDKEQHDDQISTL